MPGKAEPAVPDATPHRLKEIHAGKLRLRCDNSGLQTMGEVLFGHLFYFRWCWWEGGPLSDLTRLSIGNPVEPGDIPPLKG